MTLPSPSDATAHPAHQPERRPAGRRDPGITLAGLRAFATVVEAGGFSAAAARLGLTQPSVSAQLQALEEACGVRLLARRGRLALTPDGRALLLRARLVLSRFDEFARAVGEHRALRQGRVTIGFSAPGFAMPLLARFAAAHPGVEIATRTGNTASLLADLAECRADLAVMTLEVPPPGFACVEIARLRLGLYLRRDDPWAGRDAVPAAELAGLRLIRREQGSMTRTLLEQAVGAAPGLEVGSREAQREAVAAGLGRGYGFEGDTTPDLRLVFVPLADPSIIGAVHAVALQEMRDAPGVAALLALAGDGELQ